MKKVLISAVLVLLTVLAPGLAAAQEDEGDSPVDDLPPLAVIFIIDLSGSMNESFDDERTKLDVAKEAFVEAFTNASPNAFVGLRVYGDQLPARAPAGREQNCTEDTRLIVPISKVDRNLLIDEVLAFDARGDTPIGLALRSVNDDIPEGTLGTVVLFSDGRDECFDADLDGDPAVGPSFGEDPCQVARELAGEGLDLRIDRVETVGFRADEAAELQLRCIADSTGGSYTPIETPEDARDLLPELLADISSPREAERLGGTPIEGTVTQGGAPEFPRLDGVGGGDGRFVDTIELNTEQWYRASEYGPGSGTLTATVFGLPAQEGITFGLRLYLPASDQTFFENRSDDNAGLPRRPTNSVRCSGCWISGGPNDAYWIIGLSAENPALGGTYDLELLTEGPAFGGLSTSCVEPQECWYEQEVPIRAAELAEAQTQYDELVALNVPQELVDQRDELADERDSLVGDLDVADGDATDAEATAGATRARADSLAEQADALGGGGSSFGVPLVVGLLGVAAGGSSVLLGRRRDEDSLEVPQPDGEESVVIGTVTGTVQPDETEVADPGDDAEEPVTTADEADGTPAAKDEAEPQGKEDAPTEIDGDAAETVLPPDDDDAAETVLPPDDDDAAETVLPPDDADAAETVADDGASSEDPPKPVVELPDAVTVMRDGPLEVPEEGWYEDPEHPGQLRWWDGESWTDHTNTDQDGSDQS